MNEKIYVYGHNKREFENEQAVIDYLTNGLFTDSKCRYRYTLTKNADVIVFSWKGLAYGHMSVEKDCPPDAQDKIDFPPVKKVYIIKSVGLYEYPVRLSELDIVNIVFGKQISYEQFNEIRQHAGNIKYYFCQQARS